MPRFQSETFAMTPRIVLLAVFMAACPHAGVHAQALPPQAAPAPAASPTAPPGQHKPSRKPEKAPEPAPDADLVATLVKVQSVPKLLEVAASYDRKGEWPNFIATMKRVEELRPHAGTPKYEIAAGYSMLGDKSKCYDQLLRLKDLGWGFEPEADTRFEGCGATKVWTYVVDGLKQNRASFGKGEVAFTLPKDDLQPEAIAYDPVNKRLLVGSMREGTIYKADKAGKLAEFIRRDDQNRLFGVQDMAVDAERKRLWVIANASPTFKHAKSDELGLSALYEFALDDGKFLARHALEGAHALTALAVAPSGEVYAAESATRTVYRLREGKLQVAFASPKFTSIRGIAISSDGARLYMADYELGIAGVDLNKGRLFELKGPKRLTLFGVESLYFRDGTLILVQHGMQPKRITRLTLTQDGEGIASVDNLDVARPEFTDPTRGTFVDDRFYFIANSQRSQYDRYGLPRDAAKLAGVVVYSSSLVKPQLP